MTQQPERIITPVGADLDMLLDLIARLGNRRSDIVSPAIIQKVLRVGWVKARVLLNHLRDRNLVGLPNHLDQRRLLFGADEVAEIQKRVRNMEASR
jgi:hypothetical protein